jgi:copper homeostasis protein CutC
MWFNHQFRKGAANMTKLEAKRIEKLLTKAHHLAMNAKRAFALCAEIESALSQAKKEQMLDDCPACKQILKSWHDHKEGCKLS